MLRKTVADRFGTVVYYVSNDFEPSRSTLFFLHGLTADHTMFERQFQAFRDGFNIIAWDAPAHGESRPYEKFTYGNAVEAMRKILEDLGVSKLVLIGQSMGGFISQAFILRYPETVKAFVAIDSAPYGDCYSRSDMWWLRQVEWMSKLFPERLLKSAIAKQNAVSEFGRSNMAKMLNSYNKSELCRLMGIGYAGFLEDNRPLEIPCPTLLLVGEKDRTGKVRAYNKMWAKRTGFPLIWIPNAAHNSNVDNPETVNEKIKEFIKSLR